MSQEEFSMLIDFAATCLYMTIALMCGMIMGYIIGKNENMY